MNWTFGIITHEPTQHHLDAVLNSICDLNIPKYEIIVVGGSPVNRSDVYQIPFDDKNHSNWITKKKNLISQNACFENLVIMHDYVSFDANWYDGFENFGDEWDVCMNKILNTDGRRFRDWVSYDALTIESPWIPPSFIPYWDQTRTKRMYVSGTYFCVKRDFFCKNPLDESRVWGQNEDVEWSLRVRNNWNYRCNPNSIVRFLKNKPHFPEPTVETL